MNKAPKKKTASTLSPESKRLLKAVDERLVKQEKKFERYVGVMSESFQDKIDTIVEQFGDMNKKIDGNTKELTKVTAKLDEHEQLINRNATMIDRNAAMIAKVMEDTTILKGDAGIIKSDLAQKVDRKEFTLLERRVRTLESKVRA